MQVLFKVRYLPPLLFVLYICSLSSLLSAYPPFTFTPYSLDFLSCLPSSLFLSLPSPFSWLLSRVLVSFFPPCLFRLLVLPYLSSPYIAFLIYDLFSYFHTRRQFALFYLVNFFLIAFSFFSYVLSITLLFSFLETLNVFLSYPFFYFFLDFAIRFTSNAALRGSISSFLSLTVSTITVYRKNYACNYIVSITHQQQITRQRNIPHFIF